MVRFKFKHRDGIYEIDSKYFFVFVNELAEIKNDKSTLTVGTINEFGIISIKFTLMSNRPIRIFRKDDYDDYRFYEFNWDEINDEEQLKILQINDNEMINDVYVDIVNQDMEDMED